MSLLRTEPSEPVHSLDELFALAEALENEAAAQYAGLAHDMHAQNQPKVAAVFAQLATAERDHAGQMTSWARCVTGAVPEPARIRWQPPETFDEEAARTMASSSLASAYRALSMAVRNEERAFILWTHIAAQAEDPAIQTAAERMAVEELHHAALLRVERRRAFHDERQASTADSVLVPPRRSPAEEAAWIERTLARLLSALAEDVAAESQVPDLRRLAAEAAIMAGETTTVATDDTAIKAMPTKFPEALRLAERAVELYLDAAAAAQDEASMQHLHVLAEGAIARIALLRDMDGTGRYPHGG